jgi:guanylate kinase
MLEHAEVHGNYYGTSKSRVQRFLDSGNDVILEIDVQGAKSVMDRVPDAVSIFVMPPSFEALTYRLTTRATESPEELSLRLKNSFAEVMRYADFEYVILNDEVTAASRRLSSIILAERQKRVRQTDAIQDILNSFDASKHQGVGDLTNYGQQKRRNN